MNAHRLEDIGRVVTGKTPKTSVPAYFGGDIQFITPSDMDGHRKIIKTERHLSEQGAQTVKNCIVPAETVLVSCIGSDMGKTHISTVRAVTNQQINSVVVDAARFCPLFVYYNLFGRREELRNLAAGSSAQPILNKSNFASIEIEFPARHEQDEIAAILGALDEKIELNRKTAATLEAMARALYRSWFVDFDPVWAKTEGRPPAHMDAATAALFPDRFTDEGLPVGWEIASLGSVCEQTKQTVKPMEAIDTNFWHFSLPAFDSGAIPILESGASIKSNKLFVPNDAILFSRLNPSIPRVWWARCDQTVATSAASTEFFVAMARNREEVPWLYSLLSSAEFLERALSRVTGTSNSHQRVPPTALTEIEIVVAPSDITSAFGRATGDCFERVHAMKAENQTLATLRDTLLPRLMSGELRVGAARELVEEVA